MLIEDAQSLSGFPIFAGVDKARLKLIVLAADRVIYAKGEIAIREGAETGFVGIILSGEMEVSFGEADARVPLATLRKGDIFGEMGVVLKQPAGATVTATGDATVLQIERSVFEDLLQQLPAFSMALIRELARRLARISENYARALRGEA
ncbi:MAG: cyclic nucleotide-binding domain-containing protein [Beijerinckiaceae bacterium]